MAVDLNSATGSFLGAVVALLIFCTKEEVYPLETSTDDKCFIIFAEGFTVYK